MAHFRSGPESNLLGLRQELDKRQAEYQRPAKVSAALYQIAEETSTVQHVQAFYTVLQQIVGEFMCTENFSIALCNTECDVITFLYPWFVPSEGPAAYATALQVRTVINIIL